MLDRAVVLVDELPLNDDVDAENDEEVLVGVVPDMAVLVLVLWENVTPAGVLPLPPLNVEAPLEVRRLGAVNGEMCCGGLRVGEYSAAAPLAESGEPELTAGVAITATGGGGASEVAAVVVVPDRLLLEVSSDKNSLSDEERCTTTLGSSARAEPDRLLLLLSGWLQAALLAHVFAPPVAESLDELSSAVSTREEVLVGGEKLRTAVGPL